MLLLARISPRTDGKGNKRFWNDKSFSGFSDEKHGKHRTDVLSRTEFYWWTIMKEIWIIIIILSRNINNIIGISGINYSNYFNFFQEKGLRPHHALSLYLDVPFLDCQPVDNDAGVKQQSHNIIRWMPVVISTQGHWWRMPPYVLWPTSWMHSLRVSSSWRLCFRPS